MLTRPLIRTYYRKENQLSGNLGDALVLILRNALGYEPISQQATNQDVLNAERSLHGAILAQAYGVPWAAYLGIPLIFVADRNAGMRWWQTTGVQGSIRDIEPLLAAFPYQRLHLSPSAQPGGGENAGLQTLATALSRTYS